MSCQKLLQQMIEVALVMLLLVGCGAPAATPTPIVIVVTATPPPTVTPVPTATEDVAAKFRAAEEEVRRCYEQSKRDTQLPTALLQCPAGYQEPADCASGARETACAYFRVEKMCQIRLFGRTSDGNPWDSERSKRWEDIWALEYDSVCSVCRFAQRGEEPSGETFGQGPYYGPAGPGRWYTFIGYVKGPCPPEAVEK
jgi:hypothetical protein